MTRELERKRKNQKYVLSIALFFGLGLTIAVANGQNATTTHHVTDQQYSNEYPSIQSVFFEKNIGQMAERVAFSARHKNYSLFLASDEAVFTFNYQGDDSPHLRNDVEKRGSMAMKIVGANQSVDLVGLDPLKSKTNYLIGNDPTLWHIDVPHYAKVRCANIYQGVDLFYYGTPNDLEYDFVVHPGVNPNVIKLKFESSSNVELDESGSLVVPTPAGRLIFQAPNTYQYVAGSKRQIKSRYEPLGDHYYSFKIAAYDESRPLVIDPVVVYSTYLGGSGFDVARGLGVDRFGNSYVTGWTDSTDFPTDATPSKDTAGSQNNDRDAYVAKLDSTGTRLIYSTYIGGSEDDFGFDITVDRWGYAYITGSTASDDFPTQNPVQSENGGATFPREGDVFVAQLNHTGTALLFSTFLGGQESDSGGSIALDWSRNIYITGNTQSRDFPVANAIYPNLADADNSKGDVFVAKLDPSRSKLIYSTYLGGSDLDLGNGIDVDIRGNVYVTGATLSEDFPLVNAFQSNYGGNIDAFVVKLNRRGTSLIYSTYLGGEFRDFASDISVDIFGHAYVGGDTASLDFPVKNAYQGESRRGGSDGFVSKFNRSGTGLVYSTYFGGSQSDGVYAISVDFFLRVSVAGETMSEDFPILKPIQSTYANGGRDGVVAMFNRRGSDLLFSTYLGGGGFDLVSGIETDLNNIYVSGDTSSTDFPSRNAFQAGLNGRNDGFVAKIHRPLRLKSRVKKFQLR